MLQLRRKLNQFIKANSSILVQGTYRNRNFSYVHKSSLNSTKVYSSASEALNSSGLSDGSTLLVGGFGLCGIPMALIQSIQQRGTKNLTIVSNNCGTTNW
jgi:citrate lyase alpha subunit